MERMTKDGLELDGMGVSDTAYSTSRMDGWCALMVRGSGACIAAMP